MASYKIVSLKKEITPNVPIMLTKGRLAVQDVEVIVHAGCQQQVLMGRVPLQPPHSTTHGTLTERLPHVPAIPQQNLLIVAAESRHSEPAYSLGTRQKKQQEGVIEIFTCL